LFTRVLILVADGARADLFSDLLRDGRLPNIQRHLVERGCYRTALSVFPSTTGPAHIPFVCGVHPGTADIPGYRWLDRALHDRRRRSIFRHRSLNSPRGLAVGRDMDRTRLTSVYEHFDLPSSVLELIDFCPGQNLYKVIARRLWRIVQAHRSDDWSRVDEMVERLTIERLQAGSECIVASFFGIDEYSHLYSPFDDRTVAAYQRIDQSVGRIAEELRALGVYDDTVMVVVSDHGLTPTTVHIPLVDIVKRHGFDPYYYPRLYRRRRDSAVMESGNAMAAVYFKRGARWGAHWTWDEMRRDARISALIDTLLQTEGIALVGARTDGGIVWAGREGRLLADYRDGRYRLTAEGRHPLGDHPLGECSARDLFTTTFGHTYPDAVNQLRLLFTSPRSGDLAISADPGYDLRLQHEDPEHHGSHGSLHRDHMHVPLAVSVPLKEERVSNCDVVPTVLRVCGKEPKRPIDGVSRACDDCPPPPAAETPVRCGSMAALVVTLTIILTSLALTAIFRTEILDYGKHIIMSYGETSVDLVLFVVTAISSTPLALPIWAYTIVGIALGMSVLRLAVVMALGSATGSVVTFLAGRWCGNSEWVRKRFPALHRSPWTAGRSKRLVTLFLFLGTASPMPCDVLYVAAGAKRYPISLFWLVMVAARFVRYIYMGYGFVYCRDVFEQLM